MSTSARPISTIANEICRILSRDFPGKWHERFYGAVPYLEAMLSLNSINDRYIEDTGYSMVAYFLSNMQTWRGDDAKRIKAELNAILKSVK